MKRLLVILIGMCYLAAGAGFTLRSHYCMGELIGTAIEHPAHATDSHRCDRCGMEKKSNDDNGCCKDEVKTVKSSPDQVLAKVVQVPAPFVPAALPAVYALHPAAPSDCPDSPAPIPAHGPPDRHALPIYLQIRSLLI